MTEEELEHEILFLVNWGNDTTAKISLSIRNTCFGVSEQEIRNMVWRLVDRGTLEFTKERRLVVSKEF